LGKRKLQLNILFLAILFLTLSACKNPLTELPEEVPQETELNTTYVDSVLEQLRSDLKGSSSVARVSSSWDNNLTLQEIDAIIAAARSKIESKELLESTNLAAFLPLVVEGAQSQLKKTASASSTSIKMNVIETLISSSIRIIDNKISSEAGKTSLIVSVTETVVKNIPQAGIGADEIDDVAGGAVSIVTSTTEGIFTIDSISNVVSSIASTSIKALSVAYNSVGNADSIDVSTGVSVVTGSILGTVESFTSLEGDALGETLVKVTSRVNSSIGILASNIDSTAVAGQVTLSGLGGEVISTVTNKLLSLGTLDDAKFLKEVVSDSIATIGSGSGDIKTFASEITSIAVQSAVAATAGDPTPVISDIVESVAEAVTVADNTVILSEVVTSANTGLDQTSLDNAINSGVAAAANNAPVINSLNLSESTVILGPSASVSIKAIASATDPDGDLLTYSWSLPSSLTIDGAVNTNEVTIRVPDFTGDFRITVVVDDGKKTSTEHIYFTVVPDNSETNTEAAIRLVKEGKNNLSLGNFTEALNLFAEARAKDSANDEAALFWAYLNIGAIAVDPIVQEVAAGAGFVGYPRTLEEFITGNWMSTLPVYDSYSSYDTGGNLLVNVSTSLFPEINIPTGMNSIPYYDIALNDSSQLTVGEYMNALAYNLQSSYPMGFNAPVSQLVSFIKEKLDGTASALTSLTATDSISLEPDMFIGSGFDPFTSLWPTDAMGAPKPIIVGEAEARLSMAALQIINSLMNSLLAVDLSVDLAAFYGALNMQDGIFWDKTYLESQRFYDWNDALKSNYNWSAMPANPFATGFLQTSAASGAVMAESKQYMSNALANLAISVDGFQARGGATSPFTFSKAEMGDTSWTSFKDVVDISGILVDKMALSLTDGTSFTVPLEIFTGEFRDYTTNWPTTAKWTNVSTFAELKNAVAEVNFSKLFDKPVLALDNLIELNTLGEPVIYSKEGTTFTPVTSYNADQIAIDKAAGKKYALKLKDITFGSLFSIPGSVVSDLITDAQPRAFITDSLSQVSSGSTISYYISLIEPSAVFSALNPVGSTSDPNPESANYVKATGSFWYAMVPMVEEKQQRILDNNDTVAEAEPLTVGAPAILDRTLTYNDEDFYKVTVTPGSYYKVSVTTTDNTSIRLEVSNDSTGNDLNFYNSTSINLIAGQSYGLIFENPAETSRIIKVQDASEWNEKAYSIKIEEVTPTSDGNDTTLQAVTLPINGTALSGTLTSVDNDYYKISLTAGTTYKFLMNKPNSMKVGLGLVDEFDMSPDGPIGYGFDSDVIYHTCKTTGVYYLKVYDNYISEPQTYDISASTIALTDDGSNDAATAIVLTPGSAPTAGSLTLLDTDYFSFNGTAGTTYTVKLTSTESRDLSIVAEDSLNNVIANEWGYLDTGITLTFQVVTDGVHYISFNGPTNEEVTINYDIALTQF